MSKERLLATLTVSELEQLLRRAISQCLEEPEPTPDLAAVLGRVAAEIHFELWLRERPMDAGDWLHRQSPTAEIRRRLS